MLNSTFHERDVGKVVNILQKNEWLAYYSKIFYSNFSISVI